MDHLNVFFPVFLKIYDAFMNIVLLFFGGWGWGRVMFRNRSFTKCVIFLA